MLGDTRHVSVGSMLNAAVRETRRGAEDFSDYIFTCLSRLKSTLYFCSLFLSQYIYQHQLVKVMRNNRSQIEKKKCSIKHYVWPFRPVFIPNILGMIA